MLDVYKVSSVRHPSSLPHYTTKPCTVMRLRSPAVHIQAHRLKLKEFFARKEDEDISASAHCGPSEAEPPRPEKGLKNTESLGGLPGVLVAPDSTRRFEKREGLVIRSDEESVCISGTTKGWGLKSLGEVCDLKVLIAFLLGVGVSVAWTRFVRA